MARPGPGEPTESGRAGRSTPRRPRLSDDDLAILERLRLPGEAIGATLRRAIREAERAAEILRALARLEEAVASIATRQAPPSPVPSEQTVSPTPSAVANQAKMARLLAATDEDRWG